MGGGENPFWDYSLAVYGRGGVAEACLALQDAAGLDVNLLLLCCFAGSRGRRLGADSMGRLMAAAADWQGAVVRPLRQVRRRLKKVPGPDPEAAEALRQAVKEQELRAERIEQDLLYACLCEEVSAESEVEGEPPVLAAANLAAYLEASGHSNSGETKDALAGLLRGAFPDLSAAAAARLLSG